MTRMALTEFLLAQIAEDEAAARRLLRYAQENELAVGEPQMLGRRIPGWHEWPDVQTMCSRVLAECEAKRRIVETPEPEPLDDPRWKGYHLGWRHMHGQTLRLLALPYAQHADYREEWR